ncbi:MAG: response regulator [Clostridia bacterium]|nr:response regulator [Deltaproteobacteria bacterium]
MSEHPDRKTRVTTCAVTKASELSGDGSGGPELATPLQHSANPTLPSTELLEANEQLVLATLRAQVAEEAMREAARHKDEFLAMLGHELRNPLVPIRNAAAVLQQLAGGDKRLTWVHDVLVRQVGHMTRLVDDLLDISLVARGKMQLRLEPVDVGSAIGRALEATQELIEKKRHRLKRLLPREPVWVEGDAIRLIQVFENLLTNAAKYTDDQGLISVTLEVAESVALIRVGDNGLGIAPEMQSRIFELFIQDARSLDRSQGGLGIGLALVRHLVDIHRGSIEVHSDGAGKGSEFLVRLPLLPVTGKPANTGGLKQEGGTGRVMIVDDDADAGESMAVLLNIYGYDVERAFNLESAMQVGSAFRPQVVLMDIALPGADGYEVARRLRAMPAIERDTIYIAVTGFGSPEDHRRSEQAGFAHHLVKPVDPVELDAILKQALKARRKGDSVQRRHH